MVNCAIASCKNWSGKTSKSKDGITFHRFPRDKERRRQWEMAVHREADWSSTSSSAVCSEHFEARDFYITESGLRKLGGEAVPSLNICMQYGVMMDFDENGTYVGKTCIKMKEKFQTIEEPQKTILHLDPIEINPEDSPLVIQLKHKLKRMETIANNRKKRLKLLWQSKKRLKKKLEQMKCMVKELVKHRESNEEVR